MIYVIFAFWLREYGFIRFQFIAFDFMRSDHICIQNLL